MEQPKISFKPYNMGLVAHFNKADYTIESAKEWMKKNYGLGKPKAEAKWHDNNYTISESEHFIIINKEIAKLD